MRGIRMVMFLGSVWCFAAWGAEEAVKIEVRADDVKKDSAVVMGRVLVRAGRTVEVDDPEGRRVPVKADAGKQSGVSENVPIYPAKRRGGESEDGPNEPSGPVLKIPLKIPAIYETRECKLILDAGQTRRLNDYAAAKVNAEITATQTADGYKVSAVDAVRNADAGAPKESPEEKVIARVGGNLDGDLPLFSVGTLIQHEVEITQFVRGEHRTTADLHEEMITQQGLRKVTIPDAYHWNVLRLIAGGKNLERLKELSAHGEVKVELIGRRIVFVPYRLVGFVVSDVKEIK